MFSFDGAGNLLMNGTVIMYTDTDDNGKSYMHCNLCLKEWRGNRPGMLYHVEYTHKIAGSVLIAN